MTDTTAFASRPEKSVSAAFDGEVRRAPSADALSRLSQSRIAIERVWPEIDGGRFAVKRAVGDTLTVEADIYCDRTWADPPLWTARAIRNVAGMARFSSDRAVREYADRIWGLGIHQSRRPEC
jgi:glucan phosphorylase